MFKLINWQKLYHGSIHNFDKPNLQKCKNRKDFGKGFYLTTDKQQAIKFIRRTSNRNNLKEGYLYTYRFDLDTDLKILEFSEINQEWLNYITSNRVNGIDPLKYFDIISGAVADDTVATVLNAYITGLYGNVLEYETIRTAIRLLRVKTLTDQHCFKTQASLKSLKLLSSERIDFK